MRLNYDKKDVADAIKKKLRNKPRSRNENNVWYTLGGKKILRVTYPHGRGLLPPGTTNSIINQLKLDKSQFKDFVRCPLSSADYEQIIRSHGIV